MCVCVHKSGAACFVNYRREQFSGILYMYVFTCIEYVGKHTYVHTHTHTGMQDDKELQWSEEDIHTYTTYIHTRIPFIHKDIYLCMCMYTCRSTTI